LHRGGFLYFRALTEMDKEGETLGVNEKTLVCLLGKYIIAPLTPILGVSDKCFDQSMAYIDYLIPDEENIFDIWALRSIKMHFK